MSTFNIHAGHNPEGKIACGAVGILNESREDRIVKDKVIAILRAQGHTVHDCTVDDGASQSNVLTKIVNKCNAHTVDLDVSIHFNAGANDTNGNGSTTGTEVYVYSPTSKSKDTAQKIVNSIAELGFKNRGVKYSQSLYVLKKTKSPALLIECCFVDDRDDANLYNADKMASAIVKGITGSSTISTVPTVTPITTPQPSSNSANNLIKVGQQHSINFTGHTICVDGIAGVDTEKQKARVLQLAMNLDYNARLEVDGAFGAKSKSALGSHYVKKGEKQYMVTAAEILMYLNGINPSGVECPGTYGNGLANVAKVKFGGDGTRISASNFLALI